MKKNFQSRLEAIDWIANFAENEGQFEVWREQLTFNHIYSETFYLELNEKDEPKEVIILEKKINEKDQTSKPNNVTTIQNCKMQNWSIPN